MALRDRPCRRPRALAIAFAFAAGAAPFASAEVPGPPPAAGEAAFLSENDAAMSRMMKGMAVTPTGDVDRDFVAMMVPHHQGAIDMAEAELHFGRNQQVLRIAQEIVVGELQEIAAMRAALGERLTPSEAALAAHPPASASSSPTAKATDRGHGARAAEQPFLAENDAAMAKMMEGMTIKPAGDIDRDFVALMVPHHQGAIDMAEAELCHGHDANLRRTAQEIIVDQIQQITLMRLAVGETLPPSLASPTDPHTEPPTSAPSDVICHAPIPNRRPSP